VISTVTRNPQPTDRAIGDGAERHPGERAFKFGTTALRAICVCVLSGILLAGLWPFRAPKNEVSWLSSGNGLVFGKYGSIVSAEAFRTNQSQADNACSVEIWLEPSRANRGGTILAFYRPASGVVPFALRQWRGGLVVQREGRDRFGKKTVIYVADLLSQPRPVFVTISSSENGTAVYLDGKLVKRDPNLDVSNQNLTGELIIGNDPSSTYNWSGQLKGLAVYYRELDAAEVSQNFIEWTKGNPSDHALSKGAVARYLFDEGKGNVVHNRVDSATNLLIPKRFFLLHQQFLERPWNEFHAGWNYWKDVGINVGGFIPLGFFFHAYFVAIRKIKRAAAGLTIALGFAVSLTIEVLQAFLPTRDSGMTDLITNTCGAALGVMLCAWTLKNRRFAWAGVNAGDAENRRAIQTSAD
jgi:hypothetical protein